jgi:hypothetical protein
MDKADGVTPGTETAGRTVGSGTSWLPCDACSRAGPVREGVVETEDRVGAGEPLPLGGCPPGAAATVVVARAGVCVTGGRPGTGGVALCV